MIESISSRERTLAAINHKEADRVPIFFRGIAPFSHLWKNQNERIDVLLKMGVDEKVYINIGSSYHPDVTVRDWIDDESDKEYSLACREFNTPKGTLKLVMRRTPDCRYENGVPLAGDHNVSRGVEFPIKSRDDLPKLACLMQEPTKDQIARFRERARSVKKLAADELRIPYLRIETDYSPSDSARIAVRAEALFETVRSTPRGSTKESL